MMPAAPAASPLSAGSVAQVALSLALIIALIFAVSWALKRLRVAPRAGLGHLGVIDELAVGPRERILLVRVGDAQLLIGVGAGGIVALAPLPAPISLPLGAPAPGFAARLREVLGRGGGTPP